MLGAVAGALAIVMATIPVLQVWPARVDPQLGVWTGAWVAALDAGLWLVILIATLVEFRQGHPLGAVAGQNEVCHWVNRKEWSL